MDTFPPRDSDPGSTARNTEPKSAAHQAGVALRGELANLKSDLDALISHEATLSDGELSEAYARILARLGASSTSARAAAQDSGPHLPSAYQAACEHVRQRPLQSVAAVALSGLVAGWLMKRH